jgi:holin-like protein
MIKGIVILLSCLLAGTYLQKFLPIPGSMLGMCLLFVFLLYSKGDIEPLQKIASILLPLLPLFIIPIAVGVMTQKALFLEHGVALLVILSVSLIPGIIISGYAMSRLVKRVHGSSVSNND